MTSRPPTSRIWPLFALNFFMADMQSGIGPFVGVFLQERGWATGLIGTAMTIGNVAGMLVEILSFQRIASAIPGASRNCGSWSRSQHVIASDLSRNPAFLPLRRTGPTIQPAAVR